jgi:hypothetical protein
MVDLRLNVVFIGKKKLSEIETRLTGIELKLGRLISFDSISSITNEYPEPLATPLALEKSASLHTGRYFSLLDAGEAFIKYSWAIAVSLTNDKFDLVKNFRQPPSIGSITSFLREMLQSRKLSENPIGKILQNSFLQENGKLTQAGRFFLEEYTNIRNKTRGHSSSLPDGAYEMLYARHSPELHDSLEKCSHIQLPLIKIESANPESERISYDIRLLVGPPPFTHLERIETETRLRLDSLYIWDRENTFIDLMDFLICRACPICNLDHTFFLEQVTNKMNKYHSYYGNHRC